VCLKAAWKLKHSLVIKSWNALSGARTVKLKCAREARFNLLGTIHLRRFHYIASVSSVGWGFQWYQHLHQMWSVGQVRVTPGQSTLAFYTAENQSKTPITGVSTYNVTPMKVSHRFFIAGLLKGIEG
jgi:hypothetical protein